jgi:ring-1,2-phenylacetyl-CoA epoxidase subunit PaaE
VGDVVTSLQPSGRFTLESMPNTPRDIVLLGAGSGITPLFSMLQHALHFETAAHVTLIFSNRDERNTIFYQRIRALETQFAERFTVVWIFSDPQDHVALYRRMNNSLLETLAPQHLHHAPQLAQFFICGPADYMRTVQFTLTFMGFGAQQVHKENFVVNTEGKLKNTPLPQDASVKTVTLRHGGGEVTMEVPGNEAILHAALRKQISLPYSCKGGVCGSCTARCTEGKVWMSVNEVLTEKELGQGMVLTCTGYAQSEKVTLEW